MAKETINKAKSWIWEKIFENTVSSMDETEIIMLSEIIQTKTLLNNITHLWNPKNTNDSMYKIETHL